MLGRRLSSVHLRQILLIGCGRPRDNALSVCTFKQQSQKAVFAHFTSEQIFPLQANNVLQPVVWGRPRAVGVYTPCLLSPRHVSLYPLRLCNMVHCDIKTADCGIFPFNCKYLRTKNDIFVIFS